MLTPLRRAHSGVSRRWSGLLLLSNGLVTDTNAPDQYPVTILLSSNHSCLPSSLITGSLFDWRFKPRHFTLYLPQDLGSHGISTRDIRWHVCCVDSLSKRSFLKNLAYPVVDLQITFTCCRHCELDKDRLLMKNRRKP
jgi:hypothetical protein